MAMRIHADPNSTRKRMLEQMLHSRVGIPLERVVESNFVYK